MKRRISLILSVIILLSLIPVFNVSATLRGTSCENEAALLAQLGILKADAVTAMNTGDSVTRKEFAEYVEKAVGETDETVEGYTEVFTDFTATDYVAKGVSDGFITGYPDGSFKPAQTITVVEAEKMIIDAAGYKKLAELKGKYPDSYFALASEIGLSENVTKAMNAEIDMKDAIFLIYNMLNLEIPLIDANGKGISFDEDMTILSEKFDIRKGQGIITANQYTNLSSPDGVAKGMVEINGELFEAGISGAENYIGYNVEFYYRTDKDGNTVVYADPAKKSNDLRIYADEIESFEDNKYYYLNTKNSVKASKAKVDSVADVIYNGKAMPEIDSNDIYTPEYGHVTLIDNNNDGVYDVISIVDRKIIVLNMYDDNEYVFYDKYNYDSQIKIDPEDPNNVIKVVTTQGNEMKLDGLKEWDVLEIAQSVDGEITDIMVNREMFSGAVKGNYTDSEGDNVLNIDGAVYKLDKKLVEYNTLNEIVFNNLQTYNFILSSDGVIVGYNSNVAISEEGKYGFLIKTNYDEVDETFFYIRLFTSDSEFKTFRTATKVKIDGVNYKKADKAYEALPKNQVIIYYKTDENGFIKEIDTVEKTKSESINSLMVKGTAHYKYSASQRTVAGKVTFNADSIVFVIPNDIENSKENEFVAKKATEYFQHYRDYNVVGYARDLLSPYTEAVVVRESVKSAAEGDIWLVQKVSNAINEDEEEVMELELTNASGTVKYKTESMQIVKDATGYGNEIKTGVQEGDAILVAIDSSGVIVTINVVYRPETDKFYPGTNPTSANDFLSRVRIGLWDVAYKYENFLRVIPHGTSFETTAENIPASNIFVYEKDGKLPYRVGTINEVRDYHSTKMASKVLIRTNDGAVRIMVIYK